MLRIAAFVLITACCAAQIPADHKREALERALAEKLMSDLESQTPRIADRAVEAYVEGVERRLTPHCGPARQVEVRVLVSDERTAHGILKSYLVVNSGFLVAMESEAELAGVLAHMLSYMRDGGRPRNVAGATIPLVFLGGWSGYTYGTPPGGAALAPEAYSRILATDIAKADAAAVQCLAAAGYDPEPFRENLLKIADAESRGNAGSPALRYLPASARVDNVDASIRALPPRTEYVLDRDGFADIRNRAAATVRAVTQPKREPPTLRRDAWPPRVI
jgi:predicted Zn-dependent protease